MKRLILLGFVIAPLAGFAQQFSIANYRIAGGGGASGDGQFSLNGTIGQAEATAAMSGGAYGLAGGYWAGFAVPIPEPPPLSITLLGGSVVLSWPASDTGFIVQENRVLGTANWQDLNAQITVVGDANQAVVPMQGSNNWFRLKWTNSQ